jgi:succinate-semialdehyde dehydrogenase/glutarate-semialdehyde dehydrogenase
VRIQGYEIAAPSPDKRLWVAKEAIGVCAAITPWNFPLAIPARKLAPAWAAGCPVLLKPSPECPLSALALADISQKAGLPEGVFQILCGDEKMLGELLLQDTRVRKLSFTGSTEVGKTLYRACAPSLKRVTLELGGHAPFIVFDDADLEQAVQGLLQAKFRNTGQTCVSPNRIYVHQDVYTVFVQRLVERCKRLREGDPRLEETDLSCFLHPSAQAKVKLHLEDALGKGAELLYAGEGSGAPRILSRVDESMLIAQEETFGPVIPLFSFESETEVLRAANASPFGLAAYVFTQGLGRARRCVEALEFGVIGLNDGAPSNPHAPFGGLKASGLGKEGGQSGMAEYLVEKFVSCLA